MSNFSLLREPYSKPARPLPIALAHCFAAAKVGDNARQALLYRIFQALPWAGQMQCQAERLRCNQAKRGDRLAVVL